MSIMDAATSKCESMFSFWPACLKLSRTPRKLHPFSACDPNMSAKTTTSEYVLLFRNTGWHKDYSAEEIQEHMARFTAWFEQLSREGRFKGGGPLAHSGKMVESKTVVTDGPFVESKEAIAGFFQIYADSLEEAVEIAKGCPGLTVGQTVEVRAMSPEAEELEIARQKARAGK